MRRSLPLLACIVALSPAYEVRAAPAAGADAAGLAAVDPPDVESAYRQAFDAMARGDLDEAARLFEDVAARTADPVRRETSAQMALRARERPAATSPAASVPAAGAARFGPPRMTLVLGSASLGFAAYGWMLPRAIDARDLRFVETYMLTAAGSIVAPYLATRGEPIGWGTSTMYLWGATRGFAHGYMLDCAFTCGGNGGPEDDRRIVSMMMGGSILEGVGSAILARRFLTTPGTAHTIANGSDFGALTALGLGVIAQANEIDGNGRILAALGLLGAAGGATGGAFLASRRNYTWGDAEVMRTTALLGIAASGVPLLWAGTESPEVAIGVLLAGELAGFFAGDRIVKDKDYGSTQALFVDLGTAAGLLAGLGLSLTIVSLENLDDFRVMATAGAAGAITGFYLTTRALAPAARSPGDSDAGAHLQLVPRLGLDGEKGLVLAGSF